MVECLLIAIIYHLRIIRRNHGSYGGLNYNIYESVSGIKRSTAEVRMPLSTEVRLARASLSEETAVLAQVFKSDIPLVQS